MSKGASPHRPATHLPDADRTVRGEESDADGHTQRCPTNVLKRTAAVGRCVRVAPGPPAHFRTHPAIAAACTSSAARSPDPSAPCIHPGRAEVWSPAKCTRPSGRARWGRKAPSSPGANQA